MKLNKAIVKRPAESIVEGISTNNLGKPDYRKALVQHKKYVEALKKCGLEVTVLEASEEYPDSTFVEDPAVVTDQFGVITNPGEKSRKGETKAIEEALANFFPKNLFKIEQPGKLDGGDVLKTENHIYIGITERTNRQGAEQLIDIFASFGFQGTMVELEDILHLKTGIAYLGDNTMVTIEKFKDKEEFKTYNKIIVKDEETYAANCLRINDLVILPAGFTDSREKIEKAGFDTITVDVSEFRKVDGGLSCLSLRF